MAGLKTILQDEKKCLITGDTRGLHRHHAFGGPNRKLAEEDGLWVYLRWDYHIENSPHETPHNSKEFDLMLKKFAQRKYEETHTRQEFMDRYGRNWLDDGGDEK